MWESNFKAETHSSRPQQGVDGLTVAGEFLSIKHWNVTNSLADGVVIILDASEFDDVLRRFSTKYRFPLIYL
ncbi:MAG: hypothetical protein Tsb009_35500 [Planctomycetaceae bacterium]